MSPSPASRSSIVPLYQHIKAHEWGLAMVAWERGTRRGYQFEDGKLRVFCEGYYELLSEVDTPADQARDVIDRLRLYVPVEGGARPAPPPLEPTVTLDQQIEIFRAAFPEGFAGTPWQRKRRGVEARRNRRHRSSAITDAAERLAEPALTERISGGRATEVIILVMDVLGATDAVTQTQLSPLRELPSSRHGIVAQALSDLMWSDAAFKTRFERAVSTLALANRRPSWQLATALPALLSPGEHLHVVPAIIRRQAGFMAPRLALGATPEPRSYLRTLDMVQRVREALDAAGLPVADLWDVHDFMAETLTPKAAELLQH